MFAASTLLLGGKEAKLALSKILCGTICQIISPKLMWQPHSSQITLASCVSLTPNLALWLQGGTFSQSDGVFDFQVREKLHYM